MISSRTPKRVVAAAVERLGRHALEVAHARQREVDQAVEELAHAVAAQRDHRADLLALAQLEVAIDFLALVTTGCWPVISASSSTALSRILGLDDRLAEAHVDGDPRQLGRLHRVLQPELLHQLGPQLLVVERRAGAAAPGGAASRWPPRVRPPLRRPCPCPCPGPLPRAWPWPRPAAPPSWRRLAGLLLGLVSLVALPRLGLLRRFFVFSSAMTLVPDRSGGLEDRAALHADPALLLAFLIVRLRPGGRRRTCCTRGRRSTARRVPSFSTMPPLGCAWVGSGVALDHVDPLDHHAVLLRSAGAAPCRFLPFSLPAMTTTVSPRDVASRGMRHHSTSGASEMIFMNRLARSSRATGPKMRVPIGSLSLLMRTAELASKRM